MRRRERRTDEASLPPRSALGGWGGDDAEVAAAVEHAHEVEHAVEVALLADGDGGAPELFDEGFFVGAGCGGETAHSGGGEHAGGVTGRKRFPVEGVLVDEEADALADKETLNAVA